MNLKSQQEVDTEDFNYNKPMQADKDGVLLRTKDTEFRERFPDEDTGAFWLANGLLIGMILFIIGFVVSLIV